jgi:hypothetical protein
VNAALHNNTQHNARSEPWTPNYFGTCCDQREDACQGERKRGAEGNKGMHLALVESFQNRWFFTPQSNFSMLVIVLRHSRPEGTMRPAILDR